jgi:Zn-dependent protease
MSEIWSILIILVIIVISMTLHEMAHGFVAYRLGDPTPKADGRLTFNPIKHLDLYMSVILPLLLALTGGPIFGGAKPVRIDTTRLRWKEWGFALVAIAGPLTNFIIAFIAFQIFYYVAPTGLWGSVLLRVIFINLGFCIFNLIPIPPLDGSRVLYALAPAPVQKLMNSMEKYGIIVVLALVLFGGTILSGLMVGAMQGILMGFEWLTFS